MYKLEETVKYVINLCVYEFQVPIGVIHILVNVMLDSITPYQYCHEWAERKHFERCRDYIYKFKHTLPNDHLSVYLRTFIDKESEVHIGINPSQHSISQISIQFDRNDVKFWKRSLPGYRKICIPISKFDFWTELIKILNAFDKL